MLVQAPGTVLRLLVTDLSGSPVGSVAPAALDPAALLAQYGITAVVLPHDGVFDARERRLGALGFVEAATFGPYSVLTAEHAK